MKKLFLTLSLLSTCSLLAGTITPGGGTIAGGSTGNGAFSGSFTGNGGGLTNVQGTVLHMGLVDSPGRLTDSPTTGGVSCWQETVHCIAQFPITNLLFGLPNFGGVTELGSGGTIFAAFSIEYPIGVTITSGVFGGTNLPTYMAFDASRTNLTCTISNGSYTVGEVHLGTNALPTGANYIEHIWGSNSLATAGFLNRSRPCRKDDSSNYGNSLTNNTLVFASLLANTNNTHNFFYDPFFLAALTDQKTVLLLGASWGSGLVEIEDNNKWNRYGQQRLYNRHSCVQVGCAGDSAANYINNGTNRLAVAQFAQIVVIDGGVAYNSYHVTGSGHELTDVPKLAGMFPNAMVYCETSLHKPNTTDNYATLANQTPDTTMVAFNNALTSGAITNVVGCININKSIEPYINSGLYQTTGQSNWLSGEGPFYPIIAASFGGDPLSTGGAGSSLVPQGVVDGANGVIATNQMSVLNGSHFVNSLSVQSAPLNMINIPVSPNNSTNAWTFWADPTNGCIYVMATNPAGGYLYSKLNGTVTTTP